MGTIKCAWELASERVIASRYARDNERAEAKCKKLEQERLSELPDFVQAWELSQREENGGLGSSIVEDVRENPTRFIHKEDFRNEEYQEYATEGSGSIIVQEPETITFDDPMEIHWYGHFTSYSGFSRMNRAMVFGLANRNVKIKLDIQRCGIEINKTTYRELQRMEATEVSPSAPKIFGATIPLSMTHGGKKILYTMMENDQTLHREYVERLNLFDEIWVPTEHGANIFKRNGVTRNVVVMPLGVETSRYTSEAKSFDIGGLGGFRFISVFKWGYRKGYDILLKAYMEEFSSQDDVSLILVSRSDSDNNPNRIPDDFKAMRMGIDKKDEDLPHVSLYNKPIAEKDMPSVYKMGDAFVLISRGEGFGLPYYEAAACGLPVIGSNCSGQKDLLTEDNSYLVDPDDYVTAKINGPLSQLAKHCRFYEDQIFPDFGPNAIMKTREHMRFVFENYDEALKKAAKLQKYVHKNSTWEKAVNKVYNRIQDII